MFTAGYENVRYIVCMLYEALNVRLWLNLQHPTGFMLGLEGLPHPTHILSLALGIVIH